jgi:hypothetical protein
MELVDLEVHMIDLIEMTDGQLDNWLSDATADDLYQNRLVLDNLMNELHRTTTKLDSEVVRRSRTKYGLL